MYYVREIQVSTSGLELKFSPPQLNTLPLSYDAPFLPCRLIKQEINIVSTAATSSADLNKENVNKWLFIQWMLLNLISPSGRSGPRKINHV